MITPETTAEASVLKKFNPSNLPPAGSEWVGKFFNSLWEEARKEKIDRLGLHARWMDLHAMYRGKKKRQKYPRVGANYLFKTVESFCATLTEKVPIAEITADDADNEFLVKAFDQESQQWWVDTEQQALLHASSQNMQIYGTTIEKGTWNPDKDDYETVLRDTFNFFPFPGYRMCDMDLPGVCDVDFLEAWEIRGKFGVPEEVTIPADADEQLAGTDRQTVRGGRLDSDHSQHYPSNYASVPGSTTNEAMKNKTMVVEMWIRDRSVNREPVMVEQEATDDLGRPVGVMEMVDTGEVNETPVYPDGIRRVVICPALMTDLNYRGVLADSPNPSINWELLNVRAATMVESGIIPDEQQALSWVYDRAKTSYPLWGRSPYSATPSRVDTTQWWGFSIIEQLEELQGKAELMLTKYLVALEKAMFPILILPQGSGVTRSRVTNEPGQVFEPTIATAPFFRYLEMPNPPSEYLEALQFILFEMDIVSMSPEVSEGRRPKGVSAASAIIALQDKAATLFTPQVRQIDKLIRERGRMWAHFKMNFDTTPKQVIVEEQPFEFRGIDLFANFKFNVESGSSAPITKAGRRQQYIELFKLQAMDLESLLTMLEIPNPKLIVERLLEQNSVPGAIQILVQAGLPVEWVPQIAQQVMGDQFAVQPQGGTTMPTAEQAGGYSEGMTSANNQMAELRE